MKGFVFQKYKGFLTLFFAVSVSIFLLSCKKKNQNEENPQAQEVAEEKDSEYDFYLPSDDNASWVEALLERIEEERIAEELKKMEESVSDYQLEDEGEPETDAVADAAEAESEAGTSLEPEEELNPVEKFFEEAKEGRALTDIKQEMRFYEFDTEVLSSQQTSEGLVIVHADGGNVIRNFYDQAYNLVKKEEWKIKSAADASKLKTESFVYSEESRKVIQKDITTAAYFETILYNDEKSPVSAKKYNFKDDKKYIVRDRRWSYDSDNQLLTDEQKEYSYADGDYKKEPELFIRRYEYKYPAVAKKAAAESEDSQQEEKSEKEKSEIPPDSKYYENNILKMHNVYTEEKGTWVSTVYFDENLSVKTYYENEIRIRDEYYNRGRLFRTKLYENEAASSENENEQTVIHQGKK